MKVIYERGGGGQGYGVPGFFPCWMCCQCLPEMHLVLADLSAAMLVDLVGSTQDRCHGSPFWGSCA